MFGFIKIKHFKNLELKPIILEKMNTKILKKCIILILFFRMAGASIIIFSVVVIATKSWVAGLNSDNVHRKRLHILTK